MTDSSAPLVRRRFLGRVAAGAAAFGAAFATGSALPALAAAQRPPIGDDPQDAWLGALKGAHKNIYDCVQAANAGDGFFYAKNFYEANARSYKLKGSDLNVIVSVRHMSTVFGFNDAMWAKYKLGEFVKFDDPATKVPAVKNVHAETANALAKEGLIVTVCGMATKFFAGEFAKKTGAKADDVYAELTSNLVTSTARMVAAGVIVVNRAQEHGIAYTYVG